MQDGLQSTRWANIPLHRQLTRVERGQIKYMAIAAATG